MSSQSNIDQGSGFWFGLMMGAVAGGAGLYFLATDHGRKRMRKILEAMENLDAATIDSLTESISESVEQTMGSAPANIHSVLDKIQASLPVPAGRKFFAKDGKVLK